MSSYSSSSCHGDSESESEFNPKDEANDNLDDSNEENDSNEEKKQYDSNEENESNEEEENDSNEEEENDSNEEEEYLSDEQDSSNIYESEPNVVDHIVHADNATTHHLYYNIDETPITFIPYKRREEIGRHGILMPSINCRGQAEIRTQFLDYNVTSIGSGISNNIMIRGFGIKGIHCIIHVINDVVYIEDKTFTKTINVSSDKLPLLSSKKNPSTNIVAPAFKELHSGSYIDLTQHIRFYYYDINGIEPKENANIVVYKIDDADKDIKLIINSKIISLDTTQFNSENMSNVLFEFVPAKDVCFEIVSWSFGNVNEHVSWLIGTTRTSEKPKKSICCSQYSFIVKKEEEKESLGDNDPVKNDVYRRIRRYLRNIRPHFYDKLHIISFNNAPEKTISIKCELHGKKYNVKLELQSRSYKKLMDVQLAN